MNRDENTPSLPRLRIIDPGRWEGETMPDRQWIVRDMIPGGTVSLLYGDGGAGKTTLALQLGVARALGRDWVGTVPEPGRTLFLSSEDDEDELHRRIDAIRKSYGVTFRDLGDFRLIDLVGEDAVLGVAASKNGIVQPTPLFDAVRAQIEEFKPDLLVADALADVFGGDENQRTQARQFVGLLKSLARRYGTACLCLAHPSLSGMSSGNGTSGSTAWSNSVRSRLYFESAKSTDGSEPDPDLRILSNRKNNYARSGSTITLRWTDGVYKPEGGMSSLDRLAMEQKAQEVFLALVRSFNVQGQRVSSARGPTYAPAIFVTHPTAQGLGKPRLALAMQTLLDSGAIVLEYTGSASRRRSHLVATCLV